MQRTKRNIHFCPLYLTFCPLCFKRIDYILKMLLKGTIVFNAGIIRTQIRKRDEQMKEILIFRLNKLHES